MRLWRTTGRDPAELTLRQLFSLVEGLLLDGRDAQGRENLHAAFEDRLAIDLRTGAPLGLDSDDPAVRTATRLKMVEQAKRQRGARPGG